ADSEDSLWQSSDMLEVPMAPKAVVKPRTYEAGVKEVRARALYDQERLAFLLEWSDAGREVSIGGVDSFRDAVAVEFPSEPANTTPYFGMGELNNPVTIYHWKADWQFARDYDVDEEFPGMAVDWYPFSGRGPGEIPQASDYGKEGADRVFHTSWWAGSTLADPVLQARTPVEKLQAEGFGTIRPVESHTQDGLGKGVWKDGGWRTVISIPRTQEKFSFERGTTVPVAFAGWDGASGERGGEKAISTWYFLSLEQPVGAFVYVNPILVVIGAAIAQILGLRLLQRRARPSDQESR
ncbi:MAG: ethylbenzene dehydrogenase-related protein, partial [Dehalococcoidia bacterium]